MVNLTPSEIAKYQNDDEDKLLNTYRDAKAASNLQFPIDESNNPYRAFIQFSVEEAPKPTKVTEFLESLGKKSRIVNNRSGLDDNDIINIAENAIANAEREEQLIRDAKRGFKDNTSIVRPNISKHDKIRLYLPAGIQIADGIETANLNLGTVVGAGLEAGAFEIGETMIGNAANILSNPTSVAKSPAASVLAQQALKFIPGLGEQASQIASYATGVAINPNTKIHFKNIKMRSFAFDFKLIPTSKREYDIIIEIIKKFRSELYPEKTYVNIGDTQYSTGFKYPKIFNIDFLYKKSDGREKSIATKIKPCYLTDVTTTYNNGSMTFNTDGGFTEIDLSLRFQEIETIDRKDVLRGY